MTPRCPETAVPIPECSCRACLEAQLARHAPALLETAPPTLVEELAAPPLPRPASFAKPVR